MPKIFQTVVRRAAAAKAGVANFLATIKPAIQIRSVARIIGGRVAAAAAITNAIGTLRTALQPAVAVMTRVSGAIGVVQLPAIAVSNRCTGAPAKSIVLPAFDIVQTFINLRRTVGASSVTEEAVGGRTDWTNDANATGKKDGMTATISGNALAARGGRLVLSYPAAAANKGALTITKVELRFYVSQTGTALGNGSLRIGYRVSGGGDVELAAYTGDVNFLSTPVVFDLTSVVVGDWAKLDTLKSYAYFSAAALNTSSAALDAVDLYVEANKTELN